VKGEGELELDLQSIPPRLRDDGASFVTLTDADGELRGCIGTVEAHTPLALDVQRNAIGSALRDPRFYPVRPGELSGLQIELSILTEPEPLAYDGPDDLLTKIRPGIDGIILEKGFRRATLLPSVWAKIPDPARFLSALCLKAGLPEGEWHKGEVSIHVYQAEKVTEA
jgi:AmmeMemoRadiSam system protein A